MSSDKAFAQKVLIKQNKRTFLKCKRYSLKLFSRGGGCGGNINGCIKQGRSEIWQFGTHKNFLHLNKKTLQTRTSKYSQKITKLHSCTLKFENFHFSATFDSVPNGPPIHIRHWVATIKCQISILVTSPHHLFFFFFLCLFSLKLLSHPREGKRKLKKILDKK